MSSYENPTEVQVNQLVLPSHTDAQNVNCLNGGQLLKWMDTAACLSAEKHAKTACVTASMDDLSFEKQIYVGQVVNLKARVNRAFNTSMEVGVCVKVEDLFSGQVESVCEVFFTFVALDANHHKVRLQPVVPFTEDEKLQYALATERRRMRLQYPSSLREAADHLANSSQLSCEQIETETKATDTMVESVELVLPPHANHHQTTFGGQVMEWMQSACTISATRLCHAYPLLQAVDEVRFRGPSKVGDRVVIRTIVNNTYECQIEVGCRVEAYSVGGEARHINSAFFIFVAPNKKGEFHRVLPVTHEEKRRAMEALARKRLRYERREIRKSVGPVIAIPWTPNISQMLNFNNIEALVKLHQLTMWQPVSTTDGITLFKQEMGNYVCVKATLEVDIPAERVFTLLSDNQRVSEWDPLVKTCRVIQEVDKEDTILYMILAAVKDDKTTQLDDVVVLVSRREPSDRRDYYTIAYRSVILSSCPPTSEYNRAENLCSGWLIEAVDGEERRSSITYLNQITGHIAAYITGDLFKEANFYAIRARALIKFLLENRADLPEIPGCQTDTHL